MQSEHLTVVAADIASRVPAMAIDSPLNNAELIAGLIEPLLQWRSANNAPAALPVPPMANLVSANLLQRMEDLLCEVIGGQRVTHEADPAYFNSQVNAVRAEMLLRSVREAMTGTPSQS